MGRCGCVHMAGRAGMQGEVSLLTKTQARGSAQMHPFALPGSARMEVRDCHKSFPNLVDARVTAMHCGFWHIRKSLVQQPKWQVANLDFTLFHIIWLHQFQAVKCFPALLPQSILILCKDWQGLARTSHFNSSFGSGWFKPSIGFLAVVCTGSGLHSTTSALTLQAQTSSLPWKPLMFLTCVKYVRGSMYESGNLWWPCHYYQILNLKKRTFHHQNLLGVEPDAHDALDAAALLWHRTMQHNKAVQRPYQQVVLTYAPQVHPPEGIFAHQDFHANSYIQSWIVTLVC